MLPLPDPKILKEQVVHFDDRKGRDLLSPGDRRPSRRQLLRWVTEGLVNRLNGERVYLEFAREGPSRVTSVQAWERFNEALNTGD